MWGKHGQKYFLMHFINPANEIVMHEILKRHPLLKNAIKKLFIIIVTNTLTKNEI